MALFIEGKTTCKLCGALIVSRAEAVGMPHLPDLPESLAELSDAVVHRDCVLSRPERTEIVDAWRRWWAKAAEAGEIHHSDPDRVLYSHPGGAWFRYVYHPKLIAVEEDPKDLEDFLRFLKDPSAFPTMGARLSSGLYRVQVGQSSVHLRVTALKRAWLAGESEPQLEEEEVLSVLFDPTEWRRFADGVDVRTKVSES